MAPTALDRSSLISPRVSSGIGKSSYTKSPLFTLETFESKDFIITDFVESLSDSAIPAARRSGTVATQAFDPKPLIRTFENALSQLTMLSEDLELKENEISRNVRHAETQHKETMQSLGHQLQRNIDSFRRLNDSLDNKAEDQLQEASNTNAAIRLGQTLEELDKQRQRAQDAKFLIQCWIEVNDRGDLSSLEDVRRLTGGDGKVRCANIARQLLKINDRINPAATPQLERGHSKGRLSTHESQKNQRSTREIVEKFLESLETDLLTQFDEFYRRQNFDGMKECASVLRDFNDGASVMALFVNQHQFFIDRSQLITEEVSGDSETWERLADPDADPPAVEPTLQSLIDEVKIVVQEESFMIKRAFPYYDEVLHRFVQRIFEQSIQQRLELVLEKASSISSLAFLRSLQTIRSYIGNLVEDLKAHGLTDHPEPASTQTAAMLDQQLEDLFIPYLMGSTYIEREKRNLEELYSSLLLKFTIYHSRRRKMPTTYLASLGQKGKELLSSAKDAYMERLDGAELPDSQKAMLLRIAGVKDVENEKKADIEVTEENGALNLAFAKRMLKWLAEGVGRGLELSGSNETPKDVQALLNILLSSMGEVYLETALDASADTAQAQEGGKTEPDFNHLPPLRAAIMTLHLLQISIRTILLPLASSNVTIQRAMTQATTNSVASLEDKISLILHKTLDGAIAWATKILATQKKTDFRPRDETAMADLLALQTPTCLSLVTFLNKAHSKASAALDGPNLTIFTTELAISVRNLLLEHFRKFNVSAAGGLLVSKDMSKYVELLKGWPLESHVEESVAILTDVGNLFVIGPEALQERLRGGTSGTELSPQEFRNYISKREDATSVQIQSVLNSI